MIPMPSTPPPAPAPPLVDPEEQAHLEAEADRVFAPVAGEISPDVMELMRDVFVIVAATHPEAVRLRRSLRADGVDLRTVTNVNESGASAVPKGKLRGKGR